MNREARNFWLRSLAVTGTTILLAGVVAVVHGQSPSAKQAHSTWSDFGGSMDALQYSSLKQINRNNVSELKQVWFTPAPGPARTFPFSPLVVGNVMYTIGAGPAIVALDATTGKQLWTHPTEGAPTNRGFNFWQSKNGSDGRIIFAVDSYLQEINAKTGVTINTFGNDGKVNLREGLGRDPKVVGKVQSSSPGHVFENLIVLGSAPGELYDSPPGDLRAYDVLTGKNVWTFHTIPHPGEFGYDTWPPNAWKYAGGANTWSEFAIDEKRGIAYFPTGSPTYDLYGADRIGTDLFGNCVLALDVRTGKRLWYFQTVHHDLWDYDNVTGPKLVTIKHDGKMVDVVAQPGKTGFLYVLDRVTGKPIWPIEERPVPKSDVPGEQSWPTQPYPTKPPAYGVQKFGVDQINPYIDDSEKARIRKILTTARNEGIFTPPVVGRTQVEIPGAFGSGNWGAAAGDPGAGMVYVRAWNTPDTRVIAERQPLSKGASVGLALYSKTCEQCHGPDRTNLPKPTNINADFIRQTVRNGRGEMPPFPENALPAADLDSIIDYLADPDSGRARGGGGNRAGGRGASGRGGRGVLASNRPPRPPIAPPPPGQVRYWGPYGNPLKASNGMPAIAPPWSELVAFDLNEGTIKWRITLGSIPALAARGIKSGTVQPRNGPVATAGGLIFIGSNGDGYVHAVDKDTGKTLWETELNALPDGIPAVYQVAGRQYVAFYANGGGGDDIVTKKTLPAAQGYYVFALPETGSKKK